MLVPELVWRFLDLLSIQNWKITGMQQRMDHVVCSQKKIKCCKRQTFCLIQPSKPGKGSRHQTVISTGSGKFLFYNSYFLGMSVLRPGGAAIPSEPRLPAWQAALLLCLHPHRATLERFVLGHGARGNVTLCALLFPPRSDTAISLHTQIAGAERKTPVSSCQVQMSALLSGG